MPEAETVSGGGVSVTRFSDGGVWVDVTGRPWRVAIELSPEEAANLVGCLRRLEIGPNGHAENGGGSARLFPRSMRR